MYDEHLKNQAKQPNKDLDSSKTAILILEKNGDLVLYFSRELT